MMPRPIHRDEATSILVAAAKEAGEKNRMLFVDGNTSLRKFENKAPIAVSVFAFWYDVRGMEEKAIERWIATLPIEAMKSGGLAHALREMGHI